MIGLWERCSERLSKGWAGRQDEGRPQEQVPDASHKRKKMEEEKKSGSKGKNREGCAWDEGAKNMFIEESTGGPEAPSGNRDWEKSCRA